MVNIPSYSLIGVGNDRGAPSPPAPATKIRKEQKNSSRTIETLNSVSMQLTRPSPLRIPARWRKGWRSLFNGRSAVFTLRTLPGATDLRATVDEAKNQNPKLATKAKGMYIGHRSLASLRLRHWNDRRTRGGAGKIDTKIEITSPTPI